MGQKYTSASLGDRTSAMHGDLVTERKTVTECKAVTERSRGAAEGQPVLNT
jgi:hypothetical protein